MPAASVWAYDWSDLYWQPTIQGCTIIGLLDSSGSPEHAGGTTHLIRREFLLSPPQSGMGITQASLRMWSDNKAAWWWQGSLISTDLERYAGELSMFPGRIATLGGLYTLAIQNSNDGYHSGNPHGTAFKLCVTWSHVGGTGRVLDVPLILKNWG